MKNAITIGILSLLSVTVVGWSATSPIYVNDSPLDCFDTPPQIDAAAFLNRSFFCAETFTFPRLPYETLNTLFFTNTSSGRMLGDPGYRFNYANGNVRRMMDTWENRGSISTDNSLFFFGDGTVFFFGGTTANWLMVAATNITSSGQLTVGSQGLLRLEGENVNLSRGRLRSGQSMTNNGFFFGSSVLSSNYFNDVGITDIYWGTGTNNALDGMGVPMSLDGVGFGNVLNTQLPRSPTHEVVERFSGFNFTNTTAVPNLFGSFGRYDTRVLTSQVGTNVRVQVVFFPTNSFDTNLTTTVEFLPGLGTRGGAWAVVGFHSRDFDIVNQTEFTNSVFLVDAMAFRTNTFLARNLSDNTRRPSNFEVTRNEPFPFFGTIATNAIFDPSLIYRPTMLSNQVEVLYSGYQAQISAVNTPGMTIPGNPLADPTNYPGRIEIIGDTVNLNRTRIRADSTIVIRAKNLVSNEFARVDAPFLSFNVGSTQPTLLISNIAPSSVSRLSGTLSAWSGTWRNYEPDASGTNLNAIDFHVLIVDSAIQGDQPVTVSEFKATGTNISIVDPLTISGPFKLDATGIEVRNALNLPFGSSWADTNAAHVLNFTNRGTINMTGSGFFGSDRSYPYHNFINSGSLTAASLFVDTLNFDNSGHLIAESGLLSIEAVEARIAGLPTVITTNFFTNVFAGFTNIFLTFETNSFGPRLAADSDIILRASNLSFSNSVIEAGLTVPGKLIMDVTNQLWAPRGSGTNEWTVQAGFNLLRKPVDSDLMGTHIKSIAPFSSESQHFWAADDVGPVPAGYSNNLAVGKLTLDARGSFSLLHFAGNGANRAIYVDFLQLDNYATNYNPTVELPIPVLSVDPGFTIYFADANVSASKLNGAVGGRIRWVNSFAGPLSSTNVTYPSGQVYTFNRALVSSRDIDSDGDGIPNFFDETPIFVEDDIDLTVTTNAGGGAAGGAGGGLGLGGDLVLSWNALAYGTNTLLFNDSLSPDSPWQVMTKIVGGQTTTRVQVMDDMPAGSGQRFYKVKIEPRRF